MGLYGDLCLAEPHQYTALADYLFRQTMVGVENGELGGGSRIIMGADLIDKLGLQWFDIDRAFYEMDRDNCNELIAAEVIIPNPAFAA
tara:strand:+ start:567 stop:830 length:264 start_codon:yes stop_codon:yes gene_type:complete